MAELLWDIFVGWPLHAWFHALFGSVRPTDDPSEKTNKRLCGLLAGGTFLVFFGGLAITSAAGSYLPFAISFVIAYILAIVGGVIGHRIELRQTAARPGGKPAREVSRS